ncbi:MAG: hypothetical protein WC307_04470 [Candidatus Nanoarchaeia archaeon]|jgi:hypothetical protein
MSLEALREVVKLFEANKIDYWVTGGYAIDLAVGKITRKHKNVDLLIRIENSGKVRSLLENKGYLIDYERDKLVANKNDLIINLIMIDIYKDDYVIPTLNIDLHVPQSIMDKTIKGAVDEIVGRRLPNELLYTIVRYSPNQSDVVIASNLRVDKSLLKGIKIIVNRR